MLATTEYRIRPGVWMEWLGHHKTPSRCYLPQSWPVYRLQRMVSLAMCLLALLFLCIVAFVLLQATPTSPRVRMNHRVRTEDVKELHRDFEDDDDDDNRDSVLDEYADEEDDEELVMSEDYEDERRGYDYNNPEFDMSYFDFSIKDELGKEPQEREGAETFKTPIVRASWAELVLPPLSLRSRAGVEVVRHGIVFSPDVEAMLKDPGLTDKEVGRILWHLRSQRVIELRDPSWERCGRPKNQWVKFSGGMSACARYRYPDEDLLLGEILSFYLARLLQMGRVPPATLARPDHPRWSNAAPQMERAGWGAAPVVALTPWITDLVRDHMPASLLHAIVTNTSLGLTTDEDGSSVSGVKPSTSLKEASKEELVRLLQWSDLLLFDYLTANYDRVAYMLDAADVEGRPDVLAGTVHNLVRQRSTEGLWLLDNESGLVDGYSLLYGGGDPAEATRFQTFHRRLLRSMCVFRRSTLEAILGLHAHPKPHELLVEFARENEPLLHHLPDPLRQHPLLSRLPERLKEVRAWLGECARRAVKGVSVGVSVKTRRKR